jgi:hypothetical protein
LVGLSPYSQLTALYLFLQASSKKYNSSGRDSNHFISLSSDEEVSEEEEEEEERLICKFRMKTFNTVGIRALVCLPKGACHVMLGLAV